MAPNKPKILLLPSWYGTENAPEIGSFFREQALLLADKYDFSVLVIERKRYSILSFLRNWLRRKPLKIITPPSGKGIITPQLHRYSFFPGLQCLIDHCNRKRVINDYSNHINELIDQGWVPDLIHAHSVDGSAVFVHAVASKHQLPYVITEHNDRLIDKTCKLPRSEQSDIKLTYIQAMYTLAVSNDIKRQIEMQNYQCRPTVIGNFVSEDAFFPADAVRESSKTFRILTITRNVHVKDNETLFNTILELAERGVTDFAVDIVGRGMEQAAKGKYRMQYQKTSEYLNFHNYLDRRQIIDLYNDCSLYLSTSIAEPFGLGQCEAMFCGKPVVASSNGGINDFISPSNGILCDIGDHQNLAEAIIKIKNGTVKFTPETIRQSVITKYGSAAFSARLDGIYQSAIRKFAAARARPAHK